jgi:TOBE domain
VIDVAYLGMVTRYSVRLDDGNTMTVARQNTGGSQMNVLAPEIQVTLTWDLSDAFPLTSHSDAETQLGAQAKGAI